MNAAPIVPDLPAWAVVTKKRRAHILRVATLLVRWSGELGLDHETRRAWCDAGAWHDALRDASPDELGRPRADPTLPEGAWHGPAAAERLAADGEQRADVLEAIRWHTVGDAGWKSTGRALYCADFLEPGRRFEAETRAALADGFSGDPDGVLREVVRTRLDNALRKGHPVHARTSALWEVVR